VGIIDDATKFEIMGFANYLGALGLREAMQVQLDIGQENIERHIKMLNKRLVHGLAELGIHMCSPADEAHMSSIASFNFGFPNGNIDREKGLVTYLQNRGIKVSLRSSTGTGGIRISMHHYNTPDEIDALVSGIGAYMKEFNITQDN
jgi:selenocysteine lyase/cysteine desulfurase